MRYQLLRPLHDERVLPADCVIGARVYGRHADRWRAGGRLAGVKTPVTWFNGAHTWRNNHLALRAAFGAGGHVHLGWTLRFNLSAEDSWECTVNTTLEARTDVGSRN